MLGDDEDGRTSEDDDHRRPLLYADGTRGELPDTAPPIYDEAVKEELGEEGEGREGERREERRTRTEDLV